MAPRLTRLLDWLEVRLGARQQLTKFVYRRLPVGTTWWHTLGSAALFLIVLQTVTGVFLAFYHVPSPEHAYDSLLYIQKEIPFGTFVRGLHYWGASLVVSVVFLHLLRVFFMGAYKYPRELSWIVGVLLEVGTRTLGRFYAAHVLILPAILYGLILVHVSMVIYQGIRRRRGRWPASERRITPGCTKSPRGEARRSSSIS